ncbi:hypothetical protein DNI29_12140 [Hymenobacter sediminis]|uniref:hypothetical protein n=1 Tax=Hymenobacter sediminis TaxID=2218621 RepID=UPI000DA662E4|nr:hypothetical protein [Hymenobacter sediminis]RPD46905.1 hypothetical protein DNI29_12140 [Hymenobacter sediminis]
MKAIGGFFELELPNQPAGSYHPAAMPLSTGRACFSAILEVEQPRRVYVPYYTCDSLLAPLQERGIEYTFYALDAHLEIQSPPVLQAGELLVYINYFGVKQVYARQLRAHWGKQLILDNTHAFFSREDPAQGWAYNSVRKFFGVPDGAYLYGPYFGAPAANDTISVAHLVDRLLGKQSQAYTEFAEYEERIDNAVRGMSIVSEKLLSAVDYQACIQRRQQNFTQYHHAFAQMNTLPIEWAGLENTPAFCYPLLLPQELDRTELFSQSIFVPWLWRETLTRSSAGYETEKLITQNLLPLPVDHRYSQPEVMQVIEAVGKLLGRK